MGIRRARTEHPLRRFGTYCYWVFWIGIAFFAVYPTCNWITSRRHTTFALYSASELAIPFVPEFVWVYLSMYVLFLVPAFSLDVPRLRLLGRRLVAGTLVSGGIFLLLPSNLGFGRALPDDPSYGALFAGIFALDLPHNLVPSLHVVFSASILFALAEAGRSRPAKALCWTWLVLLCVSTLLVHQHHVLDVIAGLLLAYVLKQLINNRREA